MNERAQKLDNILRRGCALLMSVASALLVFIFVGLCVYEVRRQAASSNDPGFYSALALLATLAFFSGHASWRLWRGALSCNGVTLMPTWFVQAFGVLVLIGIAYTGYCNPRWWIFAVGAIIAYGVIRFPKSLAETRKRNGRISGGCASGADAP
jgi:hypothetical protein